LFELFSLLFEQTNPRDGQFSLQLVFKDVSFTLKKNESFSSLCPSADMTSPHQVHSRMSMLTLCFGCKHFVLHQLTQICHVCAVMEMGLCFCLIMLGLQANQWTITLILPNLVPAKWHSRHVTLLQHSTALLASSLLLRSHLCCLQRTPECATALCALLALAACAPASQLVLCCPLGSGVACLHAGCH